MATHIPGAACLANVDSGGHGAAGLFHAPGGRKPFGVVFLLLLSYELAGAQGTWRVSVNSHDAQGQRDSLNSSVSASGRFVAFDSGADLVPGDLNRWSDIFVRDRLTGQTTRESVDSAGAEANGDSQFPRISADGRFVAYMSYASNLVTGDRNGFNDIFVRDRQAGSTERVSVSSTGREGNNWCGYCAISGDGRFVAFDSLADNLVLGDTNRQTDVFLYDRTTATTTLVSIDSAGVQGNSFSSYPSLSENGRHVTFESLASNLVPGDTNRSIDIFVHDVQTGTTTRVSVNSAGVEGDQSSSGFSSVSWDGRFVAFESHARNLVPNDTNLKRDIFVHDRLTATTTRVSVDSSGAQANGRSQGPAISADGRFVAFNSQAGNLVPNDTNRRWDIFLHDRKTGATTRVNVDSSGGQADQSSGPDPGRRISTRSAISGDGRFVSFSSNAGNLVPGDTNKVHDVFVHGPYLTLEASAHQVSAGSPLTLTTWTGHSLSPAFLAIVEVNGVPANAPATQGRFGRTGAWTLSGTVPPGLAGLALTFQTTGIAPTGKVDRSNPETVFFR